ncbi:MAG: hypothetical protein CMM76_16245 [Rhodospirillaceae bacterium]|nr:hypothetical protein [Rhodospirillaceae bacterium]
MSRKKAPKGVSVPKGEVSWYYRWHFKRPDGSKADRKRALCHKDEPMSTVWQEWRKLQKELVNQEDKLILDDLWKMWKDSAEFKRLSIATRTNYGYEIAPLRKHFGEKPLDAYTLPDAKQYLELRQKDGNGLTSSAFGSRTMALKERKLLQRLFDWGAALGYCQQLVCTSLKVPKNPPKTEIIEDWQFEGLRRHLSEIGDLYCVGAYLLIARMGDMRSLTPEQLEPKGIKITQEKVSGVTQYKEYNEDVDEWLERALSRYNRIKERCLKEGRSAPTTLLCKPDGGKYTYWGVESQFTRAKRKLEASLGMDMKFGFTFHTIKHTTITNFVPAERGATKQQASGHKSEQVLRIYDHEVPVVPSNVLPRKQQLITRTQSDIVRTAIANANSSKLGIN